MRWVLPSHIEEGRLDFELQPVCTSHSPMDVLHAFYDTYEVRAILWHLFQHDIEPHAVHVCMGHAGRQAFLRDVWLYGLLISHSTACQYWVPLKIAPDGEAGACADF